MAAANAALVGHSRPDETHGEDGLGHTDATRNGYQPGQQRDSEMDEEQVGERHGGAHRLGEQAEGAA